MLTPPVLPPRAPVESVDFPPPVTAVLSASAIEPLPEAANVSLVAKVVTRMKQDWLLLSSGLAAGVALGICVWLFALATGEPSVAVVAIDGPKTTGVPMASVSPTMENADLETDTSEPEETVEAPLPETEAEAQSETVAARFEQVADDSATVVEQQPLVEDRPAASNVTVATPASEKQPRSPIKFDPVPKSVAGIEPAAKEVESAATAVEQDDPQDGVSPQPMSAKARNTFAESAGPPARVLSRTEIDERLATPLPTVQFVKVPLAQFTDFIVELTGVPITLDAAVLAGAGRTRQTPVTVKLSDTTAAEALRTALKSLGLSCAVGDDGQIVVTVDESRRAKK